jgi:hypothetical protein
MPDQLGVAAPGPAVFSGQRIPGCSEDGKSLVRLDRPRRNLRFVFYRIRVKQRPGQRANSDRGAVALFAACALGVLAVRRFHALKGTGVITAAWLAVAAAARLGGWCEWWGC